MKGDIGMPFFNPRTLVECVEEENHNNTKFFFELAEGIHLEIGTKFDNNHLKVVSLKPLKVIECY